MKKFLLIFFCVVCLMCFTGLASATTIEYTAANNGGGNYTLSFNVINDTLAADIEWFSIYFGQTTDGLNFTNWNQFSNFSPDDWGTGPEPQPANWDSYSFEPSAINLPGQFNSDALASGIAAGNSLGGFTVSFDWTGVGSYDGLYFEVGNFGAGYAWLDDGYTVAANVPPPPIPEPATMTLLGVGLAGLGFLRKKFKGVNR